MSIPTLVTGDDFVLPVNLTVNGVASPVNTSAIVTAGVTSQDHSESRLGAVVQSKDAVGANWAGGTVIVAFAAAETAQITKDGLALLEIQVAGTSKDSWFTPVRIVKGQLQ